MVTNISRDILLIHGGLYEGMTARKFWVDPGVFKALTRLELQVWAPDRIQTPRRWNEEASHLAREMGEISSAHLVAASNGCTAAIRLAVDYPGRITSLILCWPATAGDPRVDAILQRDLLKAGCSPEVAQALPAFCKAITDFIYYNG